MLRIEHVTKKYQNFTALCDVDLTLDHGVYGLLAPNGVGKTTLLKMLATLLFPTEGRILYNGTEIQKLDERYREKIGFLPQEFGYYRNQTPHQYLRYIGILKGIPKEQIPGKTEELLALVGLEEVKDKKMKKFSGGMVQRVGIAQALLGDPEILILDEPTAGLDPKERVRFRKILSSLSKNKTVLISTHIVSDVESVANWIILLKDKKICCNEDVEEICEPLRGKVFETEIPEEALPEWEKKYLIVSQRQERKNVEIRFLADRREDACWRECEPGLEDVFLYTYRE